MAGEHEPQPETPLQGDAVQLDTEETLTGDPNVDPLDAGYVPPDRPSAIEGPGLTAEEEHEGEPLADKLAAEEPDDPGVWQESDPRSGRLYADDEGAHTDEQKDMVAHDAGIDGGSASAEEAAIHERDEE